MKKMLVIGIIFILIGGVFCGAAYAFGERYISAELTDASVSFTAETITKINISEHVAEIKFIKSGSTGDISVKAENILESEFKCELVNNTLKVSYNPSTIKLGFIVMPTSIFNWNNRSPVINIYIPEGRSFDEIYFGGGVGRVAAEEINAKSLVLAGGVGEYNINNMNAGNLEIDGGVGSVKLNGTVNGDTKIDGGVGEIKISGQLNGNIKLKTGVGSTKLDLTGNISDYNIKVDKGVGSIKLNGNKIEGTYQNNGKYNFDIDAGVGSIDIYIK